MKSLEIIKDEVACEGGSINYNDFFDWAGRDEFDRMIDEVAERYANEKAKALLEALNESQKDLVVLHGNIYQELKKGNNQWEGVDEIIYKRIESNRKILKLKNDV